MKTKSKKSQNCGARSQIRIEKEKMRLLSNRLRNGKYSLRPGKKNTM